MAEPFQGHLGQVPTAVGVDFDETLAEGPGEQRLIAGPGERRSRRPALSHRHGAGPLPEAEERMVGP